jgi:integrase/recombinase XerC
MARIYFKKREREVPLAHVWHAIEKLERSPNSPYLFESPNRGVHKHVRRDSWSKRTTKFFKEEMGMHGYTNHTLRHGCISHLVRNEKPIKKVAQLTGHSSIRVTEIYTHLNGEDLKGLFE